MWPKVPRSDIIIRLAIQFYFMSPIFSITYISQPLSLLKHQIARVIDPFSKHISRSMHPL